MEGVETPFLYFAGHLLICYKQGATARITTHYSIHSTIAVQWGISCSTPWPALILLGPVTAVVELGPFVLVVLQPGQIQ